MALTKVTGHVIKSDTNIISHNINSSGIITAVTFDGNVSGVAVTFTGDSTIGSLGITTNLTVGGNIDVDGHTDLDNVSVAGVTTFSDDITLNGANFDITYDRSLNTVNFDQSFLKFGTSGQLVFRSTGAFSTIDSTTGLKMTVGSLEVLQTSGDKMIKTYNNGAVELYHDDNLKFQTTNTGAVVSGILTVTGNMNVEGVLTYQDVTNIDSIGIVTARSDIRGGRNLNVTGISTFTGGTKIPDGGKYWIGSDDDMYLNHSGSHGSIHNGTGNIYLSTQGHLYISVATNESAITATANGAVELYHNGTKKFETGNTVNINSNHFEITSGQQLRFDNSNNNRTSEILNDGSSGNSVLTFKTNGGNRWTIDSSGHFIPSAVGTYNIGSSSKEIGNIYIADNKRLYLGTNQSFSAYNDGSGNTIFTDANNFYLKGNSVYIQANQSEPSAYFLYNGAVKLYYDGGTYSTPKLQTTATGISVHGEVAASQEYPLTKPVLDFNFAAEKKLDPRIQFTRDSVATFVDKKGIVRYVSNNQPRFDHHPTTGVSLGLLLEKQSINYQPYSVDMSQGSGNNGVTVENNAAIAPDGTMTASKITGGTDQNTSQRLGWGTQGVNSSNYTMWSIWLKSEETSCIIQIYSNTYTFGADVLTVELADGTVGGHTSNDANFRYNLEKYPNKWWRLSWGGNGNAGGNSGGMYVAVVPAMNSARAANTGSAHSKVWYAWGLQEEVGTQRKFATSYIPTYGSAVTRASDRGTIDGDDFDDFFDRYQGAVVHETSNAIQSWTGGGSGWEFNNDNYQYNVITNISSGYSHNGYPGGYAVAHGENSDTGANSMSQFGPNSATGNQAFNNGYYAGRTPNNSTVDYNRLYKTYTDGMSWDVTGSTNTITSAVGGFSGTGTNTNVISYRNISKLEFGSDATDMDGSYQKFSGRIKRWMYYDKALTATQLENLTAQDPVTYL